MKHSTPDLVLDLPDEVAFWESSPPTPKHHSIASAADTFAEEDCGTVRKRVQETSRVLLKRITPTIDIDTSDSNQQSKNDVEEKNETPAKRISIAARVAAFEASNATTAKGVPPWVRKT